jgi:hypothetical protein
MRINRRRPFKVRPEFAGQDPVFKRVRQEKAALKEGVHISANDGALNSTGNAFVLEVRFVKDSPRLRDHYLEMESFIELFQIPPYEVHNGFYQDNAYEQSTLDAALFAIVHYATVTLDCIIVTVQGESKISYWEITVEVGEYTSSIRVPYVILEDYLERKKRRRKSGRRR